MLTIHIPARSQDYLALGSTSGTISQGLHPYYQYSFRPVFGPFGPDRYPSYGEVARQIEGRIRDYSNYDCMGDKAVNHHQVTGDLYLVPFATYPKLPPTGYLDVCPNRNFMSITGVIPYTHIVPVGANLIETYSWDAITNPPVKNQSVGSVFFRTWHFEDGRVGWGVFQDSQLWDGSKWIITRKGNIISGSLENSNLSWRTTTTYYTDYYSWLNFEPTRGFGPLSSLSTKRKRPVDAYTWTKDDARLIGLEHMLDEEVFPPCYVEPDPCTLGDLAQRCVDQQEYVDVNSMDFVNELRTISFLIPKLGDLKDPKTWGSLYLWFKYGITLTASDSKKLLEAVSMTRTYAESPQQIQSKYASDSRVVTIAGRSFRETSRYKLSYRKWPSDFMEFIRKARGWNLWPKLATAWDMIPLSFVVDWVIDVQSLLSRLDTYTDVEYFDIVACCWSRKVEVTIPAVNFIYNVPMEGAINFTLYNRVVEPRPRLPKIRFDEPEPFKNYLELFSLIVTR